MEAVLVSIGGAAGAVLRYVVGQLLRKTTFPWATLVVNTLGSFILGIVLLGGHTPTSQLLVGVGFCVAFTTFSSFSFQTVSLLDRDRQLHAVVNAMGNLTLSLIAFTLAWQLVT